MKIQFVIIVFFFTLYQLTFTTRKKLIVERIFRLVVDLEMSLVGFENKIWRQKTDENYLHVFQVPSLRFIF